jgi:hypothetical protein
MTALILEVRPFIAMVVPKLQALYCRSRQARDDFAGDAIQFIAFLLLGVTCMASSMALLLSFYIAMPVLTEQLEIWLNSGQWNAVPLSMVLTKMGHPPRFDGTLTGSVVDWRLSCETSFVIVVAASTFGCAVWIFESARSRLISHATSVTAARRAGGHAAHPTRLGAG